MAINADIITALPPLKWRGLLAPPYALVGFEFENNLAPRNVPYLDDEIHDNTGRRSFPMQARLLFFNTVEGGTTNGVRNFPEYWETWRNNLDGEAGDLEHPVLGLLRARVKNAKGEIRAETRSGVAVDITWTSTLEDPSTLNFLGDLQLDHMSLATQAGAMAYTIGIYYPRGGTAAPAPTDIFDDLSSALGAVFAAERSAVARVNRIAGRVGQMIDAVQALDKAQNWPVLDALTTLWRSLGNLADRLVKAVRPTRSRVLTAPTTMDAFAGSVGNSLADIMNLNVGALRSPIVAKGATLVYYA